EVGLQRLVLQPTGDLRLLSLGPAAPHWVDPLAQNWGDQSTGRPGKFGGHLLVKTTLPGSAVFRPARSVLLYGKVSRGGEWSAAARPRPSGAPPAGRLRRRGAHLRRRRGGKLG